MAQTVETCGSEITYELNGVVVLQQTLEANQTFDSTSVSFDTGEEGPYVLKVTTCNCCGCCTQTFNFIVGPQSNLNRESCHNYTVTDYGSYDPTSTAIIKVTNVRDEEVANFAYTDYTGMQTINFTLPRDGVFKVCYTVSSSEGLILHTNCWILRTLCSITECYKTLMMTVLCKDCNPCDDAARQQLIYQLNSFIATAGPWLWSAMINFNDTKGIWDLGQADLGVLVDEDYYYSRLMELCGACALLGTPVTDTTTNCPTC